MNKILRLFLLLLISAAALSAIGTKDENKTPVYDINDSEQNIIEQRTNVRISGRVRLVGNEPFSELVISGQEFEWYVAKDDEHKLRNLQYRNVVVEGTETVRELIFANGVSAGLRRTISNIRIISID